MKKIYILATVFMLAFGCNTKGVEKPANLIEEDKMVDILCDLSLLEAIKAQSIDGGIDTKNANKYIYKKYKIDSTQLSSSNKYYASDLEEYKKIFEKVKTKLDAETQKEGGAVSSQSTTVNPDTPQVQ